MDCVVGNISALWESHGLIRILELRADGHNCWYVDLDTFRSFDAGGCYEK